MAEENINNEENNVQEGYYKIAVIIDEQLEEILNTDEHMKDVFLNHTKIIDITDKVASGMYDPKIMIGMVYDEATDTFRPERPFLSWTWDAQISGWIPPTPMPLDDKDYIWIEEKLAWVEISKSGTPLITPDTE